MANAGGLVELLEAITDNEFIQIALLAGFMTLLITPLLYIQMFVIHKPEEKQNT